HLRNTTPIRTWRSALSLSSKFTTRAKSRREARTTTMLNAILIPDLFDPASYGLFNDAQGTPLATIRTQDGQLYAFHAETGKLLTKRENAKAGTDLLAFAEHVRHMLEEPRQARQEMTVSLGLF